MEQDVKSLDQLVTSCFPTWWTNPSIQLPPEDKRNIIKYIKGHLAHLRKHYRDEVEILEESIMACGETCAADIYFRVKVNGKERHLLFTDSATENDAKHAALDLWENKELRTFIFPIISTKKSFWLLGGIDTFVQEMVPAVPLYSYVKAKTEFSEDIKVGIAIGQALATLHNEGYTHARRGVYSSIALRKNGEGYNCYFANLTETAPNSRQDAAKRVDDLKRLFLPRLINDPKEEFKYSGIIPSILLSYLGNTRENKEEIVRLLESAFAESVSQNRMINKEVSKTLTEYRKRMHSNNS